ncbi:MAG TPA: prolyl oligopeptidase family serine peptidase [Bacteroidales bacterium]|nr:prolyl oligopeptidase family serine peptidase [Bacteroidales bacterium]
MKKAFLSFAFSAIILTLNAQSHLSIEKIMQGERFTGYSPENIQWSPDSKKIFFTWNIEMEPVRSLYYFIPGNNQPVKAGLEERRNMIPSRAIYSRDRSSAVFSKDGDIFIWNALTGFKQITSSVASETSPSFSQDEKKILFIYQNNLFSWDINSGVFSQLTDFRTGKEEPKEDRKEKEQWLYNDQLKLFKTLDERKQLHDRNLKDEKEIKLFRPKTIYTGNEQVTSILQSPDENFITFITMRPPDEKNTIIPSFVTESGYTEELRSRPKVGMSNESGGTLKIYDIKNDTVYTLVTDSVPGVFDKPVFMGDYPGRKIKKDAKRPISFAGPFWSDAGNNAIINIYSGDHKDLWMMLLDVKAGTMRPLYRQHDDAWIGGPGMRSMPLWLPDNKTVCFQSEETGFTHLCSIDITTGEKKALTSGKFEIYEPVLSKDKKSWYFLSNEVDPGINELYKMAVNGGDRIRLTSFNAGVEFEISPDEKQFALRVSFTDKPWELYILDNKTNAKPVKVTESRTKEFIEYKWRVPEFVSFKASDGVIVPARLYKPANYIKNGPAVIFVHGAGYLQNVHKWWSSYFREYMFHNFLVDNGYTVLDIDYRGSAGYGRDWRTAIYRYMGGRDLQDHIDGAKYLTEQLGVDPARIGIYGGSYGGFITLMALFTSPGTFAAGAALRPVTDWAHYNHGYTSNILNTPVLDSLSYAKSSPIYYANGLKDHLLICHGMVDDNVHFQDVVRLTQRLIELGKDNWELAAYPVESHGFVEASSWIDEYKRIFRLFEEELKK